MTQPTSHHEPACSPGYNVGEQDMLFNAYFEGDMTTDEREAFDRRLEQDEAFKRSYEEFVDIMGGLRALPFEFAPDDFVDKVQSRIRRRSGGRFFTENLLYTNRVPYEVIALVMVVVMAGVYILMESPRDADLSPADVTIDQQRLDKPPGDATPE